MTTASNKREDVFRHLDANQYAIIAIINDALSTRFGVPAAATCYRDAADFEGAELTEANFRSLRRILPVGERGIWFRNDTPPRSFLYDTTRPVARKQ